MIKYPYKQWIAPDGVVAQQPYEWSTHVTYLRDRTVIGQGKLTDLGSRFKLIEEIV